jgi:putative addiction module component (TIGR02574 family)
MSDSVIELERKIRSLSREHRLELIRNLIADLDGPADTDVEQAWLKEAQRRLEQLKQGKVRPVPGEQVFRNLKARLKR